MAQRESALFTVTPRSLSGLAVIFLLLAAFFSLLNGQKVKALRANVGTPRAQVITAIGDAVNTCARLESLTKEYQCAAVISRQAAEAAGLSLDGQQLYEAPVKGRRQPVQFYALKVLDDLQI